jgi:hypothetical protein
VFSSPLSSSELDDDELLSDGGFLILYFGNLTGLISVSSSFLICIFFNFPSSSVFRSSCVDPNSITLSPSSLRYQIFSMASGFTIGVVSGIR